MGDEEGESGVGAERKRGKRTFGVGGDINIININQIISNGM